jgi:hypothetical protein
LRHLINVGGTDCLQKNSYKEEKCTKEVILSIFLDTGCTLIIKVDALYECCNAFYHEKGEGASTVSCPKASLLRYPHSDADISSAHLVRLKMKQKSQGV